MHVPGSGGTSHTQTHYTSNTTLVGLKTSLFNVHTYVSTSPLHRFAVATPTATTTNPGISYQEKSLANWFGTVHITMPVFISYFGDLGLDPTFFIEPKCAFIVVNMILLLLLLVIIIIVFVISRPHLFNFLQK